MYCRVRNKQRAAKVTVMATAAILTNVLQTACFMFSLCLLSLCLSQIFVRRRTGVQRSKDDVTIDVFTSLTKTNTSIINYSNDAQTINFQGYNNGDISWLLSANRSWLLL